MGKITEPTSRNTLSSLNSLQVEKVNLAGTNWVKIGGRKDNRYKYSSKTITEGKMAEGTRLRELNDHMKNVEDRSAKITSDTVDRVEERLHQHSMDYNQRLGKITKQIEEVQREGHQRYEALQIESAKRMEIMLQENNGRFEQIMSMFQQQPQQPSSTPLSNILSGSLPGLSREARSTAYPYMGSSSSREANQDRGKGILQIPYRHTEREEVPPVRANYRLPYPKLKFPTFGGEEPKEWSNKCEQYFRIYQIPEPHWVEVATMHFTGKAHRWKECHTMDKPNLSWENLIEAVYKRFDGSRMKTLVREFNKLVQTSTMDKYQERFEDELECYTSIPP